MRRSSFINGSRRTRTAVARNTALASAGAAVGMAEIGLFQRARARRRHVARREEQQIDALLQFLIP